jgi:hypothetical protein
MLRPSTGQILQAKRKIFSSQNFSLISCGFANDATPDFDRSRG